MKTKFLNFLKLPFFCPVVFILVFIFSLSASLAWEKNHSSYVFYFPDDFSGEIIGERRSVPYRNNKEDNIRIFLEELILGPVKLELGKLMPSNIDLNSVILDGQILYIDFSEDMIFIENGFPLSFDNIVNLIRKNIYFNFRRIKEITITVDGQIPRSGYFTL